MNDIVFFVLGYYIHCIAAFMLIYKIHKQRSIYGLSVDAQIAFFLAALARCLWTLDTRLTETSFSFLELAASVGASSYLLYLCHIYRHTTTKRASTPFRIFVIAPLAAALAFVFHPGDEWFTIQILVAFTMYMEALGLLPQLWLMRNMHEIETLTSHYVALLVVARAFRMIFWGVLFWMGEHFLQLFLADVLHTLLSADYMYLWMKRLQTGGALVYTSVMV